MAHYDLYDDDGTAENDKCQRCGDSFLADHGNRLHCGKCGYMEWA